MVLNHSTSERWVTEEQLIKFGNSINKSPRYVKNEIIGCLYANFLTLAGKGLYYITDRALRDFRLYGDEAKYKTSEATYTVDIRKNDIKISFFTLDTLPPDIIPTHKEQGWSWNKSLRRLMFTTRDTQSLYNTIRNSIEIFEPNFMAFNGGLENLAKLYGRRRKNSGDYSLEFNFRGKFESETFLEYKKLYLQIEELCNKPVDWGGKAFKLSDLDMLRSNKFISEAISDGMVRQVGNSTFSLTGHAALIINSDLYNYERTRLSIIVRKIGNNFIVLIADNTLYYAEFIDHLSKLGFSQYDGWYRSKLYSNTDDAACSIRNVIYKFI